jgi:hypothetical protein
MTEIGGIPGFTAERALGRAAGSYRAGARGRSRSGATIVPQTDLAWGPLGQPVPIGTRGGRGGAADCIDSCVCVTAEGCPCCSSLVPETKGAFNNRFVL